MREELSCRPVRPGDIRITPACAGRTSPCSPSLSHHRDHPRVCGKNAYLAIFALSYKGSPPRVREELRPQRVQGQLGRITPACAGRTAAANSDLPLTRDHPRVCGKNPSALLSRLSYQGSPPRVREEPCFLPHFDHASGDHPRVCGKNHTHCQD